MEQEQLDERLTEMEVQKMQLAADLQATQASTRLTMLGQRDAAGAKLQALLLQQQQPLRFVKVYMM